MSKPLRSAFPLTFFLLSLLLLAQTGAGQGWTGLALSNYGGTNNLYINPASLADSRHKFYLNLGGAGANFYNTYLQLDLPGPAREFINGTRELRSEYLNEQLAGGTKAASIVGEGRLPGFMLALSPRAGLAFTNRVRAFAQASNVSESLARLARYGLDDANRLGLANKVFDDNSFNLTTGAYHEFALSYARTLTVSQEHFWKAGFTAKYLVGLGGGYVLNEGTKYQVYDGDSIQLQNRNLSYGFTNPDFYDQPNFSAGTLYGSQRLGRGLGLDLGVAYEWRPTFDKYAYRMDGKNWDDNSSNKYRLRVGLALTDLGAISYNNSRYVRQAKLANNRTVQLGQLDTLNIKSPNDLAPTLQRLVGLSSQSKRFRSALPTTLRLTADYRLVNHLYAGLIWTQSLLPASTIGQRSISSLAVIPRIEFSRFEVATPIMLANRYQKLQIGAMVRMGPMFIGSDNLGGLLSLTTTTGADVYFGVGLALHRHRHKDKDGDLVSNKLDKCPKIKGSWETKGCAPAPVVTNAAEAAPATAPTEPSAPAAAPAVTETATPAVADPAPAPAAATVPATTPAASEAVPAPAAPVTPAPATPSSPIR
ncbi:MAG TPA: DUF5723 family protein [Hymenobacter sp.]|jgi:hypothetical protein|uniref:DUF5723 family protein n=1 Tax=Hymenobacter sp. TaxID=1898978 RepID=UPI002ED90023